MKKRVKPPLPSLGGGRASTAIFNYKTNKVCIVLKGKKFTKL